MAGLSAKRWTKVRRACVAAVARCEDPDHRDHPGYGGRGIRVHPPWAADVGAFVLYAASLPHAGRRGRSLDRIDNDLGYAPGNLRWATGSEQGCNRRSTRHGPPLAAGSTFGVWTVEEGPDRGHRWRCRCTRCGRTRLLLRPSVVDQARRARCRACDRPATAWTPGRELDEVDEWRLLVEDEACVGWYVQCMSCGTVRWLRRDALRPYRRTHCPTCRVGANTVRAP